MGIPVGADQRPLSLSASFYSVRMCHKDAGGK